jgi:large subunit ribosomal protein L6
MERKQITEEIELPDGVSASLVGGMIVIKGKGGELKRAVGGTQVKAQGNKITLISEKGNKKEKKMLMSLRSHIENMAQGIVKKHEYRLKVCSGHFPISVVVAKGEVQVKNFFGEKVPRVLKLKAGVEVKVEGDIIHVSGVDKEITSQVAGSIQQLTKRPGFDRRIFQDGIYIIEKSGKTI